MSDIKNLFSGGDQGDVGDDLYNRPKGSGGSGLQREAPVVAKRLGREKPLADPRLIRHDRLAALGKTQVRWDVSKDDRMTKEEAGDMMMALIKMYGLQGESPEVLEAFHSAVYYHHTINGGSVLQPGRAVINLAGSTFDFKDAVAFLGDNLRRFFRAYANEILRNNQRILRNEDFDSIEEQEKAEQIRQVAFNRNLVRFPYLAFDAADACHGLSDAERSALASSKAAIFATGANMADRNRIRPGQSGSTSAGSIFVDMPPQGLAETK